MERLSAWISSEQGLEPSDREALISALRQRFADYGLQVARPGQDQAAQTAERMIVEGLLDRAQPERIAEVAFAAYQAVRRGAPADMVEGIGLYGYRKKLPAEKITLWANGFRQMSEGGLPPDIAADVVYNAMEDSWDDATFNQIKWGLVDGVRSGFSALDFATYVLGTLKERKETRAGVLLGRAKEHFRAAAKAGTKPQLPRYEGSFSRQPAQRARTPFKEQPAARKPGHEESEPKAVEKRAPAAPPPLARIWPGLDRSSRSYLGTPYVWGGDSKRGIDCSGLTRNTYAENEISIPRVSARQWKAGQPVKDQALREGDLLFFDTKGSGVSHVGMVMDRKGPQFIHASSVHGVIIVDMGRNKYFQARYLGARRIVP